MDVRVVGERRASGVKHGGDTDAGAQMPGISSDDLHRFRCGAEQQIIDQRLVLERDDAISAEVEHDTK